MTLIPNLGTGAADSQMSINPNAMYYEILPKLFSLLYNNAKTSKELNLQSVFGKYTTAEDIKTLFETLKKEAPVDLATLIR